MSASISQFELSPSRLGWLYRVQVPGSATKFVNGALVPAGAQFTNQTIVDYAPRLLHEHFLWSSNHPSPFISVFMDEDHARNWTTGLVKKNAGMTCTIYQVNPFQLGVNAIFDATELVRELDIDLPDAARSQAENEYLVLRSIPAEAISYHKKVQRQNASVSAPVSGLGSRLQLAPLSLPITNISSYVSPSTTYDNADDSDDDVADAFNNPRYRYQDEVVTNLVDRITAFVEKALDDCGGQLRNRRRAVAMLRDGLTDNLEDNAK
jgi:hypothetical protein